jgi:hypothetical protein
MSSASAGKPFMYPRLNAKAAEKYAKDAETSKY